VSVYKNVTITRQLTPPTSNSSGAFSYTSSNTAVATITNNAGVYSINVIGAGSTIITVTQAALGAVGALSVTTSLVVTDQRTIKIFLTTTNYTVPTGVTSVSALIVAGGGGGGCDNGGGGGGGYNVAGAGALGGSGIVILSYYTN
jgi:hypothetical protein